MMVKMLTKEEIFDRYYGSNFYCYHGRRHIEGMLGLFELYSSELDDYYLPAECKDEKVKEQLEQAILWHDAGGMPGLPDNEEIAVSHYTRNGGDDPVVISAILSTKPSNTEYKTAVERVLHDLDYEYFREWSYLTYAEMLLHNEYCSVWGNFSHQQYLEGRIKFLKSLLNRPVFVSVFGWHNEDAKINIKKLLEKLQ